MKKKIEIKVQINYSFELIEHASLEDWNEANQESREIYVKDKVKEHIISNIEEIVDDLMKNSKIDYQ